MEEVFELTSKGSNTLILDLNWLIRANFPMKKGR